MPGETTIGWREGCPALSNADIVKLHAATLMALCGALDAAGLVAKQDISRILATQVVDREHEPWAVVVSAMSQVLASDEKRAPKDLEATARPPTLTVIQGGAYLDRMLEP